MIGPIRMQNTLYYGDNLDVLQRYIAEESVDLIYLDPPFNSNQDYNILFQEQDGSRSAAQIKAFEDTWRWDETAAGAFQEVVEAGGRVSEVMQAFRGFLGDNDVLAYLSMMAPRLVALRKVLKSTGSIYLHCDPTASHYLKMLMDAVFGVRNFRNEIAWCYRKWSVRAGQFVRNHDIILFYSKKQSGHVFNPVYVPVSDGTMKRWKGQRQQAYFEEGVRKATSVKDETAQTPCPDWWPISIINPNAAERLGYPTQKPEALLKRIITASSNKGDIVLDPFCGCGTTISVAEHLERRWIGIDITHLAITLIRHRLESEFGKEVNDKYSIAGEPVSLPDAEALAQEDRFQFQCWALGPIGARPLEVKKGADRGVDGRLYFHDEGAKGKTKQIVISVKSGKVTVRDVRDLRGVLEGEKAAIGVLLTLCEPTRPMKAEAAGAGFYDSAWGTRHHRLQVITVDELLKGKKVDYPSGVSQTFKRARRKTTGGGEVQTLML